MNEPEGFEFEGFETEVDRVKKQHHDKQEAKRDRAKRERYNAQEAKRAPKIQADQVITLNAWLAGVLIAFVSSAVVSFNGITSVAVFVGLSASWMAALFFFFIELMYLLFLVAYLLLESRDDEDSRGALTGMIFFAAIAVLANAFHTLDYWQWAYLEPRMWAGIVLSVSAPIAIISASKMASRVIFAKALVQ
jgi:hypothetical protein|tara:strand:- start:48 stop:623 length:576 start_codon:yes stop_codon:yes gene_type:complete